MIILVGVDGSETALRAAKKAATLASALEAELHILSAFSVKTTETMQSLNSKNDHVSRTRAYEATIARYASAATATASTIAESLRKEFTGLSVISKAVEGTPGSTLISESQRLGAEIIVVGNKRVQGPARILGSIARTVASGANCDLYVVHTHQK